MTRSSRKILLALDTSTRTAGLALYDGSDVLYETTWISLDHHTVELAPAIDDVFNKVHASITDLVAVAVAQGPGSFTGLRIGLAMAKGLVLACHIPLIAIPTLDFLAAAQPAQKIPLVALLRAGRGRLAAGWYRYTQDRWRSDSPVEILNLSELVHRITDSTWLCGELTSIERTTLRKDCPNALLASPATALRRTAFLAELAWNEWQGGNFSDPATLAPFYLHYHEPIPE